VRRAAIAGDRKGRRGHGRGVACLACGESLVMCDKDYLRVSTLSPLIFILF
jgi:ribosomal protein S26